MNRKVKEVKKEDFNHNLLTTIANEEDDTRPIPGRYDRSFE